ncbi:hypothetical protein F2Q70_00034869 [Brassica cretica]|uniref:DUF7054 domain-containing protein n=1 Tax=Brassica cretica TaxID=69181 RepID=A0A8S9JUK1_BRACR|nr:hypothetical protein F2Q70_00034869 [Brassica cretica]
MSNSIHRRRVLTPVGNGGRSLRTKRTASRYVSDQHGSKYTNQVFERSFSESNLNRRRDGDGNCMRQPSPVMSGLPTGESDPIVYLPSIRSEVMASSPSLLGFSSPSSPFPTNQEGNKRETRKVVINVAVEGSPGPVRTMVKLSCNVEETIKLVLENYRKEGRTPKLDQGAAFELHQSHFSIQSNSSQFIIMSNSIHRRRVPTPVGNGGRSRRTKRTASRYVSDQHGSKYTNQVFERSFSESNLNRRRDGDGNCMRQPSPVMSGLPTEESDPIVYLPRIRSEVMASSPSLLGFSSPSSPFPTNQEGNKRETRKVVINVAVEGSPGPVRTMVKLSCNVEETIKLVLENYRKEGRTPKLNQGAAFELHQSHFSIQSSGLHKSVEFGEIACRYCVELESDPSGYLSHLANIYTSVGRWDDARNVRAKMEEKKLRKTLGCSWVEGSNH